MPLVTDRAPAAAFVGLEFWSKFGVAGPGDVYGVLTVWLLVNTAQILNSQCVQNAPLVVKAKLDSMEEIAWEIEQTQRLNSPTMGVAIDQCLWAYVHAADFVSSRLAV